VHALRFAIIVPGSCYKYCSSVFYSCISIVDLEVLLLQKLQILIAQCNVCVCCSLQASLLCCVALVCGLVGGTAGALDHLSAESSTEVHVVVHAPPGFLRDKPEVFVRRGSRVRVTTSVQSSALQVDRYGNWQPRRTSAAVAVDFSHMTPLRAVDSDHLQILYMGTCRQCGSWSVAGHNHKKVIGRDPICAS